MQVIQEKICTNQGQENEEKAKDMVQRQEKQSEDEVEAKNKIWRL